MAKAKSKKKDSKKVDDTEHLGLFKETMAVMFGIHPKQMDRIMAIINNSRDKINVKDYIVRDNAGARALKYLHLAIEYARHEGSVKHETDDDVYDARKEQDIESTARDERPHDIEPSMDDEGIDMERPIKECTFKDYLIELQVSDDPQQAQMDIKMASKNRDAYEKKQLADTINDERTAKANTEDKNKALRLQAIQAKKDAQIKAKRLADAEKQETGSNRPMAGMAS